MENVKFLLYIDCTEPSRFQEMECLNLQKSKKKK